MDAGVPYDAGVRHDLPDIYDDRPLRGPRPPRRVWPWLLVVLIVAAGVAATLWWLRREPTKATTQAPAPVRVVHDRPGGARSIAGAKINEAEAVLILRRHFKVPETCLAIRFDGASGRVYRFTAFNSCDRTRLGQWQVDGWTRDVSPRN